MVKTDKGNYEKILDKISYSIDRTVKAIAQTGEVRRYELIGLEQIGEVTDALIKALEEKYIGKVTGGVELLSVEITPRGSVLFKW